MDDTEKLSFLKGIQNSALHGEQDIVKTIFDDIEYWKLCKDSVDYTTTAYKIIDTNYYFRSNGEPCEFPPPTDIVINMMPIKFFEAETIPDYCKGYIPFIRQCMISGYRYVDGDNGFARNDLTAYITIHESRIKVGEYQRRSGLHIERPGEICEGSHLLMPKEPFEYGGEYHNLSWGLGYYRGDGIPIDGIYMASNLENTTRVYPALVKNPEKITDKYGGIENLREHLADHTPYDLQKNELCWITDRTPHECLPAQPPKDDPSAEFVYRQFFRIIVGKISVWYTKHNTPNPLGVQPDCPISDADKFV